VRFVVADLNGTALGEPQAYERTLGVELSGAATAGFRIRADDPLWEQIAAGETMLKVYDSTGDLCMYGPVISDEETAEGQGAKVRVTATDLFFRLTRRFVGKDTTGVGTTYTGVDSGTIAYNVLAAVNADEPTGITAGTADVFVARTVTHLWKRASDAINELGAIAGSYEWKLRYIDGSPPTVLLDLDARFGTDKTSSLFLEYGKGTLANVRTYARARSIDQLATDVWVQGTGQAATVYASDAAARLSYRRHEDVVSYGDITVTPLLDALAAAHVAIRRYPRRIVSLTPFAKTAPRYGVDWNLGDTLTARVVVNNTVRVSGAVRVWGASITVTENGEEVPTLKLVPE
jgi:hypothetical protein